MASEIEKLAADFANKITPAGQTGSARFAGGNFYSYNEPIAQILRHGKAWVTSQKFSATTSRHTAAVLRALHAAGYDVHRGAKPYPGDYIPNAPIPRLSREDAALVAKALGVLQSDYEGTSNLTDCEAARCRALAAVFEAAAEGDGATALGLHAAMVVSGEGA